MGVGQRLASVLRSGICLLWPRRSDQELLLDLGERKAWTDDERDDAVSVFAQWLVDELGIAGPIGPIPRRPEVDELAWTRAFGARLVDRPREPGVARWASAMASALGVAGKTLANGVVDGLRSERQAHRWLRVLARIAHGGGAIEAWAFHRREPIGVARQLARLGTPSLVDAGDTLLLASLLALWQRRRPTTHARGNRGGMRSRRRTPKPIAALLGGLVAPGQVHHLARLAPAFGPAGAGALELLVVEAALTEAHLAPHHARRPSGDCAMDGEAWLQSVEALLRSPVGLSEADRRVFAFRIQRMRAWRDRAPDIPEPAGACGAYVDASMALESVRRGEIVQRRFAATQPGILMLRPQLRSRDLLEAR